MNTFDKLVSILNYLANRGRNGASIKEMSINLNIPVSSLHRMLSNFNKYNFVRQDPISKRYFIGLGFLKYADVALESTNVDEISYPYMEELHRLTGETVFIAVLNGGKVICADIYGQRNLNIAVSRGEIFPFYSTASGKAILAFLPKNEEEKVLAKCDFDQFTKNTIVQRELLEKQLEDIRIKGYSLNISEYNVGINAIASPIFSYPDRITASIGAVGIAERLTRDKMIEYSDHFVDAARHITEHLHGEFLPDRFKG